jgi:hypothetical protein
MLWLPEHNVISLSGRWRNPSDIPDIPVKKITQLLELYVAVRKSDVDSIGKIVQGRL